MEEAVGKPVEARVSTLLKISSVSLNHSNHGVDSDEKISTRTRRGQPQHPTTTMTGQLTKQMWVAKTSTMVRKCTHGHDDDGTTHHSHTVDHGYLLRVALASDNDASTDINAPHYPSCAATYMKASQG